LNGARTVVSYDDKNSFLSRFDQPRTREELLEAQFELGWVYDLAKSFLSKVPAVVPLFKEEEEGIVTYAKDGTPLQHID